MNTIKSLKLFLVGSGLSKAEADTLKEDTGHLCPHCKKRRTSNWAVLDPCHHRVCFTCLDRLYDNYKLVDGTTMFVCPFCDTNVKDWEYPCGEETEIDKIKIKEEGKIKTETETEAETEKIRFTLKVVRTIDNPAKLIAIMIQQRFLKQELIPLEYVIEDEDPSSPTYHEVLILPNVFMDNIFDETDMIISRLGITDLIKAQQECQTLGKNLSFRVNLETVWDLSDSMDIDFLYFFNPHRGKFLENGYDCKAVVLLGDGLYLGHVWYFTTPNIPEYCGIYGIKSSVVNLIAKRTMGNNCPSYRKGVSYKLLTKVQELGREEGRKRIVVPCPLEIMRHVLSKTGFSEINTHDMIPERQFLSGISSTSNLYFKDI